MPFQVCPFQLSVPEERIHKSQNLPRSRFVRKRRLRVGDQPDLEGRIQGDGNLLKGFQFEPVPPGFVTVHRRGAGRCQRGQSRQGQPPLLSQMANLDPDWGRRRATNIIIHDKNYRSSLFPERGLLAGGFRIRSSLATTVMPSTTLTGEAVDVMGVWDRE